MIELSKKPFCLTEKQINNLHEIFSVMSLDEKIGQLFCPIGSSFDEEQIKEFIEKYKPGAMMYRPMESHKIKNIHENLQKYSKIPLMLAANLESGGNGICLDGTYFSRQMGVAATNNIDQAYNLGMIAGKEANAVKVYVDDKECLNYTFDANKESDKDFFDIKTGYMGLGLWDGAVSFKNLYVDKKEETKPSEPTKPSETPKTISVTLKGNGGKTVTTINKTKAGTKLPGWNKTKYKAAGKKGYVFAGWTYQGKVVNKVPASDKNIVLTAKFVKIKVGTAKLSSLKGKSGKGTGFVAKSIKYTNKYGEKRGFRFRYSTSKKMKSAKYKTTGLVKNVYTKTGLKKGKKYYVQVRYYYYDSTNQKVYGTYSKAKSVKAY